MLNVQEMIEGQTEPLSERELNLKQKCEEKIAENYRAFVVLGYNLAVIQSHKLYREEAFTFGEYVQQKWDISRRRAYEYIGAFKVAASLCAIAHKTDQPVLDVGEGERVCLTEEQLANILDLIKSQKVTLPTNEAQCRPLTVLPEPQWPLAWQWVVNRAEKENARITAAFICKCINDMLNKKAKDAISKSRSNSTERLFSESFQLNFRTFLASLDDEISKADQKDRQKLVMALEEIIDALRG